MFDIYRDRNSRNGILYDVFSNFIKKDDRILGEIRSLELERKDLWSMMWRSNGLRAAEAAMEEDLDDNALI